MLLSGWIAAGLGCADKKEATVRLTARQFVYSPQEIVLAKGRPVALELVSLDRLHGFDCPGLGIRSDIPPGTVTVLRFTPQKAGTFPFHCDIYCGSGHEEMAGAFKVTE